MSVERIDPMRIAVAGGTEDAVRKFIESDFRIRSGMCPNGCGLMHEVPYGQQCAKCGFSCNTPAEKGHAQ